MSRFIIPYNPAWDIKHFKFEITTSSAQVSIHLDNKQFAIFIDSKSFQIDDSVLAILEVFGFHKTENVKEWYLETIPDEITFVKAWLSCLVMKLEQYEKLKKGKEKTNKRKADKEPTQKNVKIKKT